MKKIIIIMASLLLTTTLFAENKADYRVVPLPESIVMVNKTPFLLSSQTAIVVPPGNEDLFRDGKFLAEYIGETTGIRLSVTSVKSKNAIHLDLNKKITNKEGYTLLVDHKGVTISGQTPAGVFYGIQTLRKSLPVDTTLTSIDLPAVKISDAPRFTYRG